MLAMALFLENYNKLMTNAELNKIKTVWLQQWKVRLSNPSCLSHKVMQACLDYMDISAEVLGNHMDWDCWPVDDEVKDFGLEILSDSSLASSS